MLEQFPPKPNETSDNQVALPTDAENYNDSRAAAPQTSAFHVEATPSSTNPSAPIESDDHQSRKRIALVAAGAVLVAGGGLAWLLEGKGAANEAVSTPTPAVSHTPSTHKAKPSSKPSSPSASVTDIPVVKPKQVKLEGDTITTMPAIDALSAQQNPNQQTTIAENIASVLKPADFAPLIVNNHGNVNTVLAQQLEQQFPGQAHDKLAADGLSSSAGIESYADRDEGAGLAEFIFNTPGNIWTEPAAIYESVRLQGVCYGIELPLVNLSTKDKLGTLPYITKADLQEAEQSSDATALFKKMTPQTPFERIYADEVLAGNVDNDGRLATDIATLEASEQAPTDATNYKNILTKLETIRDTIKLYPEKYEAMLRKEGISLDPTTPIVQHADVLAVHSYDPKDPLETNPDSHPTSVTLVSFAVQLASPTNPSKTMSAVYTFAMAKAPLKHPSDHTATQAVQLASLQLGK